MWIPRSPWDFVWLGLGGWVFFVAFFWFTVLRPQLRYWHALERRDRERYEAERNQP